MPDTMRVGDKVGLLWTGDSYIDTFAGQEVEITAIQDTHTITVRTHNAIELTVGYFEVAPALPKKRGGRKPVKREPGEKIVALTITLTESDIAFLSTLNPKNTSAAIREIIEIARRCSC